MRKLFLLVTGFVLALSLLYSQDQQKINLNYLFRVAVQQYQGMAGVLPDTLHYPRSLNTDGSRRLVGPGDWTSGFFPGSLWYLYQTTRYISFRRDAADWTAAIASQQYNTGTHDLGFMFGCSFGNGYRLTGDPAYRTILLKAAHSLSTRYNSMVGCIRSWDFGSWQFPVIIDNMMNLELLFWAFHETGDSTYYKIAVSHARKTMVNHYRSDYSSWHVVDYDPETGAVISKGTHQGASDSSDWARGQAWGLYGFVMCYRETGDTAFLHQAEHIADFILSWPGMPADGIPYWDYLAPGIPDEPRDASAAAITAAALLELSRYDAADSDRWFGRVEKILQTLSSPAYLAGPGENGYFILKHSVGSKPANSEVDVPVNYADYYYLQGLSRYLDMMHTDNPPEILGEVPGQVYGGDTTVGLLTGLDLDAGDTVFFSLSEEPPFAALQPVGKDSAWLILLPEISDTGAHAFRIIATDRSGKRNEKDVMVEVMDPFLKEIRISASTWQDPNIPGNTLDGDLQTRWSAEGDGQWILYDLDTLVWLRSVSVAFFMGDSRYAYFAIEISVDGVTFERVYDGTSSGTTLQLQEFVLGDTLQARYVRIVGYGNSQNKWNSITEVSFGITGYVTAVVIPASGTGRGMIRIYPVPATDRLHVHFTAVNREPVAFSVYDLSGRLLEKRIWRYVPPGRELALVIDISSLPAGAYYLTVLQSSRQVSRIFLVR